MRFKLNHAIVLLIAVVILVLVLSLTKLKPAGESSVSLNVKNSSIKYILQWTAANTVPFQYMGSGQSVFIESNCSYTNCFVTNDRNYFDDYTKFDVVAFAWPQLISDQKNVPKRRSPEQKYVFASIESPEYYPLCNSWFNGFFNWTWTYRLDSDLQWDYVAITDISGNVIGPVKDIPWLRVEDMDPISDDLRVVLRKKTKAAAWFVSNCVTRSKREKFVADLQNELKKYELNVDVYGRCGTLKCSIDNSDACDKRIEDDYYFYLSFENSFADDYVTEKLLKALQHKSVPVVYGGADYTRFMPDGIYLHAQTLGAANLAATMKRLIDNTTEYEQYFRWRNHYSFFGRHELIATNAFCGMCAMLNDEEEVKDITIYNDIVNWWTPPKKCVKTKF